MWKTWALILPLLTINRAQAQEDPIDLTNRLPQSVVVKYYDGLMVEQQDTLDPGETGAYETGGAGPVRLNDVGFMLWPGDDLEISQDKNGLKLVGADASRLNDLAIWEKMEAAIRQEAEAAPAEALQWLKAYKGKISPQMRLTSQDFLEAYREMKTHPGLETVKSFTMADQGSLTAAQKWLLRNWFEQQPHGELQAGLDMINENFHGDALDYLFVVAARYYASHPEIRSGLEYMFSKLDASHRHYFDHYVLNDYYPNTVFRFSHHEVVTSLRDTSLRTDLPGLLNLYPGKPVYIDFWASWCLPCRREMPAWQALKREFAAKGIAFVSVSIDESRVQWEKMANALDSTGQDQYLIGANDQALRILKLSMIPRYVLLTADHQILTANAPRPSDPAAKAMLKRLAGE